MDNWLNLLATSARKMFEQIILFLPKLLGALALLIVGYLISKLVEKLFYRFFKLIGINRIAQKSGLSQSLASVKINDDLSYILARLLFWIVLFVFFLPVSNMLGWVFFGNLVNQLIAYTPNILAAFIIILIGAWIAKILSNLAKGSAARVGSEYAEFFGSSISFIVLLVVIIIALMQMDIEVWLLSYIFIIFFAAISLGIALAFALGAKDVLRLIIAGIYINRSLSKGSKVVLPDIEGKIIEVGSVMTVIETNNNEQVSIPNSYFLEMKK